MTSLSVQIMRNLGAADANTLLVVSAGTIESALAFSRLNDLAQDVDACAQMTTEAKGYIEGFRSVMDLHLSQRFASSDEGHMQSFGPEDSLSVFDEGGWYVWYADDQELFAYDPK